MGGYIEAVLDRNLAENISRVLYPNDNVSSCCNTRGKGDSHLCCLLVQEAGLHQGPPAPTQRSFNFATRW